VYSDTSDRLLLGLLRNKMNQEDLQSQIDELKGRLDALNNPSSIPYELDKSFKKRGFIKTDFFVAGIGTYNVAGEFRILIPGVTKNSIVLTDGNFAELATGYDSAEFGTSTSQFDITNPSGDTFRYTWDGTGTNPNINASTLPVGSRIIIFGTNFNVANENTSLRPFFIITGSGANYFEVFNATPGVAENNKTKGTGTIMGGPPNNQLELYSTGTATQTFNFAVLLFDSLYISPFNN
jgi:hypothetical protein